MFGFGKRGRKRYIEGLIGDAQNWQVGFYGLFKNSGTVIIGGDADMAAKIAAGMANWIFRFGDCGPNEHVIPDFRSKVQESLPKIAKILTEDNKVEMTAGVMISAAAQDIPMDIFKAHFGNLHRLNLVMRGINIYEIDKKLWWEHKPYYHYMQYGDLSRPRFGDSQKGTLIDALAGLLAVQSAAAGSHPIEDESGRINRKAIGYIYGFADAALTTFGQDTSDAFVSAPILWQVLRHLFPGREERYSEFLAEHMDKDQAVTLGAMNGGQQYIDFVAKPRNDGRAAMGFARYLIEGDEHEGEPK